MYRIFNFYIWVFLFWLLFYFLNFTSVYNFIIKSIKYCIFVVLHLSDISKNCKVYFVLLCSFYCVWKMLNLDSVHFFPLTDLWKPCWLYLFTLLYFGSNKVHFFFIYLTFLKKKKQYYPLDTSWRWKRGRFHSDNIWNPHC